MLYWLIYLILLLVPMALAVAVLKRNRRRRQNSPLVENITISLVALFLTFMAGELFFAFYAQTDNKIATLAARNWLNRYWELNSLGYRDVEWTDTYLGQKRKILVLGDSLAEGYGIKNVEDRFSNVLGRSLGEDFVVLNLGVAGLNTAGEIDRIKGFPHKPEILIYQYYINDIEDAARARGLRLTNPVPHPWPILEPLIKNSYALNFIYWRLTRLSPQSPSGDYLSWVKQAYNDPDIWWTHQQELLTIYQGAASENVKLIVVVFPALTDVSGSREITAKVVSFFTERGVPTLDVAAWLEGVPPEKLVVNSFDAHPNEWVHQQVADKLYDLINEIK
jgi:lysophospholipase L1-like esterase